MSRLDLIIEIKYNNQNQLSWLKGSNFSYNDQHNNYYYYYYDYYYYYHDKIMTEDWAIS